MSNASTPVDTRAEPRIERWQPWIAAFISAALHLLMLFLLLSAAKPTVTTPQGAASGSRMKVDFIGRTSQAEQVAPPSPPPPQAPRPATAPPAASPVQSTLVQHADDPVPPKAAATRGAVTTPRPSRPAKPPVVPPPPQPPSPREEVVQRQAQAPAASPPTPPQRRPETWGRPPGLLQEDTAPENEGLADSPAINRGNRRDFDAAQPNLEVGGYLVYYDLRSETRLRTWKDQGMKELFIPLPGTQYYMVCPLETALRRGSGKCRLLAPDSPELQAIGDAREVINMLEVYRRGEPVWRGPGPYR